MADKADRLVVSSITTPDRDIRTYDAPQITDAYADGFGNAYIGAQVTKIELTRTLRMNPASEGKKAVEEREIVTRLTVPTPALLEFCVNIIVGAGTSVDAMETATKAVRDVVKDGIKRANTVKL